MLRVRKTPVLLILVFLNERIYKGDITCAPAKLRAKAARQTLAEAHTIL